MARIFLENEFSEVLIPSPTLARALPYVLSILIIGIILKLCWSSEKGRDSASTSDVEFALLLATMVIVAPLSWQHHLVFVLPSIVVAAVLVMGSEKAPVWRWVVGVSSFLLAWRWTLESTLLREGLTTLLISVKFYAVCALWLCLAVGLRNRASHSLSVSTRGHYP
jgi:hypothetical protein